jgi:hypothetical protein
MKYPIALLILVVLIGAAIWFYPQYSSYVKAPTGGQYGTITGVAMLGHICPVESSPPDPSCAPKAYQTRLALTDANERNVQEFNTDADGKFTVYVAPGTYGIRTAGVAEVLPYCSTAEQVVVTAGGVVDVQVSCDTGIR